MAIRPERNKGHKEITDSQHYGVQLNKAHGQHFLTNKKIIHAIVAKSELKSTDIVLEVGPGSGNLTVELLPMCKQVIAIEIDARHVAEIKKRVQGTQYANHLKVIIGDVLRMDLPYFDVCVANVPYQISSPLVFKLLAHRPSFRRAVLMFQREFALRLVAAPGDNLYCRLSVNVHLLATVNHLIKVSRSNFTPPPKVESSVVSITPRVPPPPVNFLEWDGLVRLCFSRKNKTLGAIFRQTANIELLAQNYKTYCSLANKPLPEGDLVTFVKGAINELLTSRELDQKRSQKLSMENFLELLALFNQADFHFA